MKGKKQFTCLSSAERVAIVTCASASGIHVNRTPLIVFSRQNINTELLDGSPQSADGPALTSGWIQAHSFTKWSTDSFTATVKHSPVDPAILFLDGPYSHTQNIDVTYLARNNSVSIMSASYHRPLGGQAQISSYLCLRCSLLSSLKFIAANVS
jgi:hypothetical protein